MKKVYIVESVIDVIDDINSVVVVVCADPWSANDYMNDRPLDGVNIEDGKFGKEWYTVDTCEFIE